MELIGTFGFHTSADTDKFAACASAVDGAEVPYVTEHGLARFSVSVTETIDVGSHYLFVGVVEEAEVLSAGDRLTYAYYHAVKGGKTPLPMPPPTTTATRRRFPGVTETAAGAPECKKIAWRCTIWWLHEEGYLDGLPGGLHVPHLRRSRDVRARGAVVPGLEPEKAPDDLRQGFRLSGIAPRLQRAVAPVFQPSITSAWCAPLREVLPQRPRTRRRTARRRRAPRTRRDPERQIFATPFSAMGLAVALRVVLGLHGGLKRHQMAVVQILVRPERSSRQLGVVAEAGMAGVAKRPMAST